MIWKIKNFIRRWLCSRYLRRTYRNVEKAELYAPGHYIGAQIHQVSILLLLLVRQTEIHKFKVIRCGSPVSKNDQLRALSTKTKIMESGKTINLYGKESPEINERYRHSTTRH